MIRDMTRGNPFGHLVRFFFPLLLGNLFQQLYNLVDAMIVGKGIGDGALAAVGASGTLHFLIFGFAIGLTHGAGIRLSQAFGAGDEQLLKRKLFSGLLLCLGVGLFATIACELSIRALFEALDTPSQLMGDALSYFRIILGGLLVTVMNNACITLLQSLGDSRTPFVALAASSLFNILLDWVLAIALHLGVAGAALATVLSQVLSMLICLYKIRGLTQIRGFFRLWPGFLRDLGDLAALGLPVAFMNSVTATGCMLLQTFVNRMGAVAVAAYSASMKYQGIFEQVGLSVGMATLTFVGQNRGAGKLDRVRAGLRASIFLSVLANLPVVVLLVFFPVQLAGLMISGPEALSLCRIFMPILGQFMIILGFLFVYRYACQGLGNTWMPMLSGGLEVLCRLGVGRLAAGRFAVIAQAEVSSWTGAFLMLCITYYCLMARLEGRAIRPRGQGRKKC